MLRKARSDFCRSFFLSLNNQLQSDQKNDDLFYFGTVIQGYSQLLCHLNSLDCSRPNHYHRVKVVSSGELNFLGNASRRYSSCVPLPPCETRSCAVAAPPSRRDYLQALPSRALTFSPLPPGKDLKYLKERNGFIEFDLNLRPNRIQLFKEAVYDVQLMKIAQQLNNSHFNQEDLAALIEKIAVSELRAPSMPPPPERLSAPPPYIANSPLQKQTSPTDTMKQILNCSIGIMVQFLEGRNQF